MIQDAGFSAYVADTGALEEQLADLLEQIDGVGRVQVLLTAKRGYEPAYVYNSSSRSDGGARRRHPTKSRVSLWW